jgi:hypothetical protein
MTRRTFFLTPLGAGVAEGAIQFGQPLKSGDIEIIIESVGPATPDELWVGVRTTREDVDQAFVEVFYRTTREIQGKPVNLLLHKESLGPIAGPELYGITNQDFDIKRSEVEFIRVTLFKKVGDEREFR